MGRVLGIDFGGTKILAGLVDPQTGEVSNDTKKKTHADRGADAALEQLSEAIQESVGDAKGDVQAVGIGVAGQIDAEKNVLTRAPNLPDGLDGSAIVDAVRKELDVPVWLFNDVAAAAAGEAAFGAGAGHPDFVCVFVGTGIGGAVYRNGEPYRGATNTAGELGHMVIDFEGRICGCGGLGHLEAYASRTAIVRTILAAMKQGRPTSLSDLVSEPDPEEAGSVPIRSKALKRALDGDDALVKEKLSDGAHFLAAGLASIVNFYNPPRIILGGGLVDAIDWFFEQSAGLTRAICLAVPSGEIEIVKASLGDYSGLVGAASLAERHA